jgi:YesN/AraC family two-component response regulator
MIFKRIGTLAFLLELKKEVFISPEAADPKKKKKYRILIADDEVDALEIYEDTINEMDIAQMVIKAENGSFAAQKFRNQEFDLVITDIEMPKKTGYEFVNEIVKILKFPPDRIIVLSGQLDSNTVRGMVSLGVKNILIKPFTTDKLAEIIRKLLPS